MTLETSHRHHRITSPWVMRLLVLVPLFTVMLFVQITLLAHLVDVRNSVVSASMIVSKDILARNPAVEVHNPAIEEPLLVP